MCKLGFVLVSPEYDETARGLRPPGFREFDVNFIEHGELEAVYCRHFVNWERWVEELDVSEKILVN